MCIRDSNNLANLSKQQEEEALNGNLAFVIKNHENLIMQYESFLNDVKPFITTSKTSYLNPLKKFNKTEVLCLLKSLISSINDFDLDESFKYLDKLSEYNFNKIQVELLSDIKEYLDVYKRQV